MFKIAQLLRLAVAICTVLTFCAPVAAAYAAARLDLVASIYERFSGS
jgi:hypothetical protein